MVTSNSCDRGVGGESPAPRTDRVEEYGGKIVGDVQLLICSVSWTTNCRPESLIQASLQAGLCSRARKLEKMS